MNRRRRMRWTSRGEKVLFALMLLAYFGLVIVASGVSDCALSNAC